MAANSTGVEVYLDDDLLRDAPHCPHGPTLLFERFTGGSSLGKRFFACSACRDRRECSFFQWQDAVVSDKVLKAREKNNCRSQQQFTHEQLYQRKETFICLPEDDKIFCATCGLLLLPNDVINHADHRTRKNVEDVSVPTSLLQPLSNNKTNAQYLFSEKSTSLVIGTLQRLDVRNVICVGTPRIHEEILNKHEDGLCSLLLDMDHRLGQFFSPATFCHYNMFNHHFFDGAKSKKTYRRFLKRSGKMVVVCDPPFGGLVAVLAKVLKTITAELTELKNESSSILLFFPYFMESKIAKYLPDFNMLDYKVTYSNHTSFHAARKNTRSSPVRIFTNVNPSLIELPENEGYRYCSECTKWVANENKHCTKCKSCTSKDGRAYKHCDLCNRCVKLSYEHCVKCEVCLLPRHQCGETKGTGCYICGDISHKRRDCPNKSSSGSCNKRKKLDDNK